MRKIIKIIKAFEDSKGNYLEPGFKGNVISHNRKSMEVRWANGEESVVDNIKKPLFDVSGGDVIDVSSLDNFILSFESMAESQVTDYMNDKSDEAKKIAEFIMLKDSAGYPDPDDEMSYGGIVPADVIKKDDEERMGKLIDFIKQEGLYEQFSELYDIVKDSNVTASDVNPEYSTGDIIMFDNSFHVVLDVGSDYYNLGDILYPRDNDVSIDEVDAESSKVGIEGAKEFLELHDDDPSKIDRGLAALEIYKGKIWEKTADEDQPEEPLGEDEIKSLDHRLRTLAGLLVKNKEKESQIKKTMHAANALTQHLQNKLGQREISKKVIEQVDKIKGLAEQLDDNNALVNEVYNYNEKIQTIFKQEKPAGEKLKTSKQIKEVVNSLIEKYGDQNEVLVELQEKMIEKTEASKQYIVRMAPHWDDDVIQNMSGEQIVHELGKIFEEHRAESSLEIDADIVSDFLSLLKSGWDNLKSIYTDITSKFSIAIQSGNAEIEQDLTELKNLV